MDAICRLHAVSGGAWRSGAGGKSFNLLSIACLLTTDRYKVS